MLTWDKPTPVVSFGTRTGHSSWRGTTRSYLSVLRSLARFQKKMRIKWTSAGGIWQLLVLAVLLSYWSKFETLHPYTWQLVSIARCSKHTWKCKPSSWWFPSPFFEIWWVPHFDKTHCDLSCVKFPKPIVAPASGARRGCKKSWTKRRGALEFWRLKFLLQVFGGMIYPHIPEFYVL